MDLSAKKFCDITLDEAIYLHVCNSNVERTEDFMVVSSLEQIETSMRSANARDRSKYYGPAMCAFAILDQLGTCYNRKSSSAPGTKTSIKRALHFFCGIEAGSVEARHLYAFRNAQVHDASYVNQNQEGQWYLFRHKEEMSSVVTPPKIAWDGEASTIGPDTTTLISRERLVALASDAVRQVSELYRTNKNDLVARVPLATLVHKYLLWHRPA